MVIETMSEAIERATAHAPFLARVARLEPDLVGDLATGRADLAGLLAPSEDAEIGRALRIRRRRIALAVAVLDLAGVLDLRGVVRALSDHADSALDDAIRAAIRQRYPDAEPAGFAAIALGKHGSRELNYSSDIDPIFLFDPATLPRLSREEPVEAAVRIGRRVIELLQTRDGDGYVLRIDLRLRPAPEVTPIALPVEAAITHYESQAAPWERAAFIRSRAAAGDLALGERFLNAISPFIWRRSLDFGAISEIRAMTAQIRSHHAQGQALGPGYDLKRGRGGIREVEFYAQAHQLIFGGRAPDLRAPATLDALSALTAAGRIAAQDAAELGGAYALYRTIEHRLQMIDDRQTHSLPEPPAELDRVARLHGLPDGASLIAALRPHVERVGTIYDGADTREPHLPADEAALETAMVAAGFADGAGARTIVERWRHGRVPALRSPAAQQALEAMLPRLLPVLGRGGAPNTALIRLDDMLSRLPSAINFFRLIEAQPALARLLADILAHAPTLADALARRSDLLDGLIDASALAPVEDAATLTAHMRGGSDYQSQLDRVRHIVNEKRFALGAQVIAGTGDPLDVAAGYARVADAAVEVLAGATIAAFEGAHGRVPDSELAIIALGRLGGGALSHASDLDLVYVFSGDYSATSDGAKPLGAVQYYNRLAQRVTAALSVPTAAGPLYPVDTRLRPSGNQGPLSVSLDAFALYQRENAWTWEHMALTRARPIFGSDAVRAAIAALIGEVLARPRAGVAAAAREMRTEITRHKPPAGPLDVKLLPGGLIDLEFIVHVAQLTHRTGFHPDLRRAIVDLVAIGALPPGLAEAHDLMTRLLVTMRLVAPDGQPPPEATRALVARACRMADWGGLLARLDETRQAVEQSWQAMEADDGAGRG